MGLLKTACIRRIQRASDWRSLQEAIVEVFDTLPVEGEPREAERVDAFIKREMPEARPRTNPAPENAAQTTGAPETGARTQPQNDPADAGEEDTDEDPGDFEGPAKRAGARKGEYTRGTLKGMLMQIPRKEDMRKWAQTTLGVIVAEDFFNDQATTREKIADAVVEAHFAD